MSKNSGLCSVDGCASPAHARGWCWSHYHKLRRAMPREGPRTPYGAGVKSGVCSAEGCGRSTVSRQLCKTHYGQWLSGECIFRPIRPWGQTVEGRLWQNVRKGTDDKCSALDRHMAYRGGLREYPG